MARAVLQDGPARGTGPVGCLSLGWQTVWAGSSSPQGPANRQRRTVAAAEIRPPCESSGSARNSFLALHGGTELVLPPCLGLTLTTWSQPKGPLKVF